MENKIQYQKKLIDFELKNLSGEGCFAGYASVFNIIDGHDDIVVPGAFSDDIAMYKDIKVLWQHDVSNPIGYIVDLKEDNRGLYVKVQLLLNVTKGNDAFELIKNNVIKGLSIGYVPVEYDFDDNGTRNLQKVKLKEISVVTFPANEEATIFDVKREDRQNYDDLLCSLDRAIKVLQD